MRAFLPMLCLPLLSAIHAEEPRQVSGIYPSLAMFNQEGECGTGAVVPWADRLWVITYGPHMPKGSSDKLYEITPDLQQIVRPESIGGTPANRMVHRESGQLFIGPYAIDAERKVRTIPWQQMFGRHTGNARHLTAPADKILYATMEEGIYEVDVKTLKVTELWGDEAMKDSPRKADLHGYHGKGFYSGQGVYVYANNGIHGAPQDPTITSGVLAEWDGKADQWTEIRRNQFTEVTGPGGICGSANPATDPIWAVGWDYRSLIMGVRMPEKGWTFYRLPKGSHSYDGAHGWNTEWPRIRDIGEEDLLMTMHGTFWRFPRNFTPQSSAGIVPRSNYLKVIGDFARWGDRIVMGCDDTAKSEFLNKRKAKGEIAAPQSQSNLWFLKPDQIDHLGTAIGRGAVWQNEPVVAGVPSDPYLFSGYTHRGLHLGDPQGGKFRVLFEVDEKGDGVWKPLREVEVDGYAFVAFTPEEKGAWIRLTSRGDLPHATAAFTYRQDREVPRSPIFNGLADQDGAASFGVIRALADDKRTLGYAAEDGQGKELGYYELDGNLKLVRKEDAKSHVDLKERTSIPKGTFQVDAPTVMSGSVLFVDDDGSRWRLPLPVTRETDRVMGTFRVVREVATERDLCNLGGTFFELPARNAGGFAKLRPLASHDKIIGDFCSYRGLWVVSGVKADAQGDHIVRSDDGKAALWVGAIDDIWSFGKPTGWGGPWNENKVVAGAPSDPYLMTGYDRKSLKLSASRSVKVKIEVDLTGDGNWVCYRQVDLQAGAPFEHRFPDDFSAYWIRFSADQDCTATAVLEYH